MRVIHWYPKYDGGGGVANAVRGLAEAQQRAGAQVLIAVRPAIGARLYGDADDADDDLRRLPWAPRIQNHLRVAVPDVDAPSMGALRAFAPRVIHVHGELNLDNLPAARVAAALGCMLVLSPHGGFNPHVFRRGKWRTKWLYAVWAHLRLWRHAVLHAVSPLEAVDIATLVPNRPVYCVPQGPGNAPMVSARADHGDALRFLFVGRLNYVEKGLDLLIDAFAAAAARSPRRLELVLAGPDWLGSTATIARRCADHGISERVTLTGALPPQQIRSLYSTCDIYVQLSRLEGFGLSVAEALLAGMPAVLSDQIGAAAYPEIGCLPHVLVVPPEVDAAAAALLHAVDRLPDLHASARSMLPSIQRFLDWDRCAAAHLAQYRELVPQPIAQTADTALVNGGAAQGP